MRSFVKRLAPQSLKKIYRKVRNEWFALVYRICGLFPIVKNRIVCENVWGWGDNPKNIALALKKEDPTLDVIFAGDPARKGSCERYVRFVKSGSLRAIWYLSTAAVWVDCNHKPPYTR